MCREAAWIACISDVVVDEAATLHDLPSDPGPCAIMILDLDQPASPLLAQHREGAGLRAMRGGYRNKQVAYDLNLSEITIKEHMKAILRKLGVINRTQAVLMLHDADPVRQP